MQIPNPGTAWRLARAGGWTTAGTVATLALTIGLTTVLVVLVESVVLRPFPFPEPDRLVGVGAAFPSLNQPLEYFEALSAPEYADIKRSAHALTAVTGFDLGNEQIIAEGLPERVFTAYVWDDPLAVLAMPPALGRGFSREEIDARAPVAIVSHALWQARYGGDRRAIGAVMKVSGASHTIVGVMPARARIYGTDLWVPMSERADALPRDRRQFNVIARLAPGASMDEAQSDLRLIAGQLAAAHASAVPEYRGWSLHAAPWARVDGHPLEGTFFVALAGASLVLLLACANVATIALAAGLARARDVAVRSALGASGPRLVLEALAERALVVTLGGAAGLGLAAWGIRALPSILPGSVVPDDALLRIDARAAGFIVLVLAAVSLIVGLLPAVLAARQDAIVLLKTSGPTNTSSAGFRRARAALVVAQVAIALVVLSSTALLVRASTALARVDPLFDATNLVTMRVTLPPQQYGDERGLQFFDTVLERLRALPSIDRATAALQHAPFVFSTGRVEIGGRPPAREGELPSAFVTVAASDYTQTLGVALLAGRWLNDRADARAPLEAVVNGAAARRYFGAGAAAIGQRLRIRGQGWDDRWMEIVGIVADVRNRGLGAEPQPEILVSIRQAPPRRRSQLYLLVRASGNADVAVASVRQIVRQVDPELPVYGVATVTRLFESGLASRRLAASALSVFAGLALLLSGLGIYGMLAHGVERRRREIGIRLALGAAPRAVRGLVIRQALVPVVAGLALGTIAAWAGGRLLASAMFGLRPDVAAIVTAAGALAVVALVASVYPAQRAVRVPPSETFRQA